MSYTIKKHASILQAIFPDAREDFISDLYDLENRVCSMNTDYCNGEIDYEDYLLEHNQFEQELQEILQPTDSSLLYVNGDPRGYGLKIQSEERNRLYEEQGINIYSDWGGYGILAPEELESEVIA
jgi:hypothetical protein